MQGGEGVVSSGSGMLSVACAGHAGPGRYRPCVDSQPAHDALPCSQQSHTMTHRVYLYAGSPAHGLRWRCPSWTDIPYGAASIHTRGRKGLSQRDRLSRHCLLPPLPQAQASQLDLRRSADATGRHGAVARAASRARRQGSTLPASNNVLPCTVLCDVATSRREPDTPCH